MRAEDATSRFDCVVWLGDLNSRMQKGREQLEMMLGTEPGGKSSTQHASFDDITQHDELKKVIDEGKIHSQISVVLIGNNPGSRKLYYYHYVCLTAFFPGQPG